MKTKLGILLFIFFASIILVSSCENGAEHSGVKVIYHLEGATYRSSTNDVTLYYDYPATAENVKISDITELSRKPLVYQDHEFVGWFKTRTGSGTDTDPYVYSEQFNFSTDTVTREGIELYAKWQVKSKYFYELIALVQKDDGTGYDEMSLQKYAAQAGDKFEDKYNKASSTSGYTWVNGKFDTNKNEWVSEYLSDKDGTVWNPDYAHPGDESETVKVYVEFVKGKYAVCATAAQLKAAYTIRSGHSKVDNVYLVHDIDFEGGEMYFGDLISKTLLGNGHTVSNFKVKFDASALVEYNEYRNAIKYSMFGELVNTSISDVTFDNVKFVIDTKNSKTQAIYISAVGFDSEESKFTNVSVTGTYEILNKPDSFDNIIVNTDSIVNFKTPNTDCTFNNCTVNITQKID